MAIDPAEVACRIQESPVLVNGGVNHSIADVQRIVEQTRAEQGLPPRISDQRTLERVATVLNSADAS